jgi:hypothetical protein
MCRSDRDIGQLWRDQPFTTGCTQAKSRNQSVPCGTSDHFAPGYAAKLSVKQFPTNAHHSDKLLHVEHGEESSNRTRPRGARRVKSGPHRAEPMNNTAGGDWQAVTNIKVLIADEPEPAKKRKIRVTPGKSADALAVVGVSTRFSPLSYSSEVHPRKSHQCSMWNIWM